MKKITFVCLGNICRSPMAEYLAKDFVIKYNLDFEIDSCGTSFFHNGEDMHAKTKEILLKNSINCENFSSKPINKQIFDESDYIFVMDNLNYNNLTNMFGKNDKIHFITEFSSLGYNHVPDP